MNLTNVFLSSIDKVVSQPIPQIVMEKARISLLDYLCVTIAGASSLKDKLDAYLSFTDLESGKYIAIGLEKKLGLKDAVFLNGLNGHALDYDDGTNAGIIHLGSPIFSVLLPLAQEYELCLDDVLRAAIIGYETSFTMAISIQPQHKAMGYHATGTCGVLGIAVAVSYLLNFTEEERKNAFATACVSATGMLNVLDDISELKPYNVAKSALLGLTAAQMAKAGFKGHPDPLTGDRGYFKMMTGQEDVVLKQPLLNGIYAIEKTYTKPYAACRYCHPSIEAAIILRNQYDITAEQIKNISIRTYFLAVKGHDHTVISNSSSAKMSIPYGVAVGIIYGKAGLTEYDDEHINERETLKLVRKINVVSDDVLSDKFPNITAAIVTIETNLGDIYVERVEHPKGEPENLMTEDEFKNRFMDLLAYAGKDEKSSTVLYNEIRNQNGSIKTILSLLEGEAKLK